MKILKSNVTTPIDTLPKGKTRLTVNGGDTEGIWVANDEKNKVMFLLNHALAFYPFPSWGTEWPLGHSVDVGAARGKSVEDTVITMHPEAYDHIKEFLNEDGILDVDKWFEAQQKAEAEPEPEEKG